MSKKIRLFHNGIINSTADPYASAMLVENDSVAWVGGEEAAQGLIQSEMEVVDLEGGFICATFFDSHIHLTETGMSTKQVDLSNINNKIELLDQLHKHAQHLPKAATVLGRGWDETTWSDQTLPSPTEITNAVDGRSTVLDRVDLHSGLFSQNLLPKNNSEALLVEDQYKQTRTEALNFSASEILEFQQSALKFLHSQGFTAAAHMGYTGSSSLDFEMFATLKSQTTDFDLYGFLPQLISSPEQAKELLQIYGSAITAFGGDLCVDGSIGSGTAFLRENYAPTSQGMNQRGEPLLSVEQITNHLRVCTELGQQTAFHIIGDGALELYLQAATAAVERTSMAQFQRCSHRVEHLEMANADDIKLLSSYGIVASMQPSFDAAWANSMYQERLGSERADTMNPIGQLLAEAVVVAFGSDSPITTPNGWNAIAASMNLRNSGARISARAGFRAHTMSGYRAVREFRPLAGMLVPGARADFAIWDTEELTVQASASQGSQWSTDVRSRTPLLPVMEKDGKRPQLRQTFYAGRSVYTA